MHTNVGVEDRLVRLVIGAIIITLGIFYQSWWGLVGIIPLGTALFRVCPLYMPFKISTARKAKS